MNTQDPQKDDVNDKDPNTSSNGQQNDDGQQEENKTTASQGNGAQGDEGEETTDERDKKIEELKNALARSMADLQNFKRRSEEEKGSFVRFANGEFLKALLPFVDNLQRSVNHLPENLKEDTWAKGIVHIESDLLKTLESLDVKKIKTVGEKLNPERHEGLMSGPGEKDVIIEEFEPGYLLGEMVIKVAKVKVGDGSEK